MWLSLLKDLIGWFNSIRSTNIFNYDLYKHSRLLGSSKLLLCSYIYLLTMQKGRQNVYYIPDIGLEMWLYDTINIMTCLHQIPGNPLHTHTQNYNKGGISGFKPVNGHVCQGKSMDHQWAVEEKLCWCRISLSIFPSLILWTLDENLEWNPKGPY